MRLSAVCAAVLMAAAPALAQSSSGPPSVPTRDFAATYRTTGEEEAELQMSWLTSEGILRVDTAGGTLLQDTRSNRTIILMPEERMFVDGDSDSDDGPGIGLVRPGSRVTRGGTERIAGRECTN